MGLPFLEGPSAFTSNRRLVLDNVLWSGRVVRTDDTTDNTRGIRALNELLHADAPITMSMLPIGDGLTLARKRPQPPPHRKILLNQPHIMRINHGNF